VAQPSLAPAHQQREGVNFNHVELRDKNNKALEALLEYIKTSTIYIEPDNHKTFTQLVKQGLLTLKNNDDPFFGVLTFEKGNSMAAPLFHISIKKAPSDDDCFLSSTAKVSDKIEDWQKQLTHFFQDALSSANDKTFLEEFFS
jgi:hypothetical protein